MTEPKIGILRIERVSGAVDGDVRVLFYLPHLRESFDWADLHPLVVDALEAALAAASGEENTP